jgi:hypothetical protein
MRGLDGCDSCRAVPCLVCGAALPVRTGRTTCPGDCERQRAQAASRASYERHKAEALARSRARSKRQRALGDPACREQDRRKWERIKNDPARAAAAQAQARAWWQRHKARVNAERAAERAARRGPLAERTCRRCGVVFTPQRRDAVFCSGTCRAAAGPPTAPRPCAVCGRPFPPEHGRLTCSQTCRLARQAGQRAAKQADRAAAGLDQLGAQLAARLATAPDRRRPCRECGALFLADGRGQRFCSVSCRDAHRTAHRAASTRERPCIICGQPFTGCKRSDCCCSPACRGEHKRARARARLAGASSLGHATCTCARCGQTFSGHANARYCGPLCLGDVKTEREAARIDRAGYRCIICGGALTADLREHRYTCSPACRAEAVRQKNRRSYLTRRGKKNHEQQS